MLRSQKPGDEKNSKLNHLEGVSYAAILDELVSKKWKLDDQRRPNIGELKVPSHEYMQSLLAGDVSASKCLTFSLSAVRANFELQN